MASLGDRPAAKITTREIETMLAAVGATGVSPRERESAPVGCLGNLQLRPQGVDVCSAGESGGCFRPASRAAAPGLAYYHLEEIEAVSRAFEGGLHRDASRPAISDEEREARRTEDRQDAEIVRVAAYTGLRLGELTALRWEDIDFAAHAVTVRRALSAGVESSTKSGKIRRVPLADQAAAALERLSRRRDFTAPGELVFGNVLGRHLDGSAIRRRYRRAQRAAGVRPLRFHDLRHT